MEPPEKYQLSNKLSNSAPLEQTSVVTNIEKNTLVSVQKWIKKSGVVCNFHCLFNFRYFIIDMNEATQLINT